MENPQHVLIIGSVWPEPNSSAAGSRMMELIRLFQSKNWKITFACAAGDSEYMFDLSTLGIEKVGIQLNNSDFDLFIKTLQPSIVLFDRFMTEEQFAWRVAENCPDAIRILDTIDLHCLRIARQKAFKENRTFTSDDLLIEEVSKREIASILRCDISLIISTVEMDLLEQHFKVDKALLHYIPFLLDTIDDKNINDGLTFESRNHFITIGNFLHEPNWNSVLYLKESIWPLIRKKMPDAQLHVYGAYASQKVNQLHNVKEGFYIMGRAADSKNVIEKARILLAPLRFGAGIKGKLIEAMLYGTPSVTTSIGAESMHGNLDWNGIVADTTEEFADAAVKLYSDKGLWQQAQKNGIRIINNCYSKELFGEQLIRHIIATQQNIATHRLHNFTGAMLMHHTMMSTKYMSRWIETKNKIL
jgi:glycosyltransferase involved in cell wall biosynthesis